MLRAAELTGLRCLTLALLTLGGCSKKVEPAAATGSASAAPSVFKPAAAVASGLPGALDQVSRAVNPENVPAYAGPTGSVMGIITATGDAPPVATEHVAKIKGACPEGRETYGHVFREGMMRALADVLVAVTGYEGYVPETQAKQTIAARGCAYSTRTVALTYGQTLDIVSKDAEGYVPNLLGSHMKAQLLALPGGAPSTVYPPAPGHYVLTDDIKVFMTADVFVVKYATHDVTSLDGRYEIKGIPVGKARLSAMLPTTQQVVEKDIEIKAGQPLELNLEIPFDAKAYAAAAAAPAASGVAPAGSAGH
ncbi:MAG TPA: hypothetical protein VHB79_09480 [Polyangiaceae bacterium]|nr:hypothetical protein [Polyangiaceae bacterium]